MTDSLEDIFKDYPQQIDLPVTMGNPNDVIEFYSGKFLLKNGDVEIWVEGQIQFEWTPSKGAYFHGTTTSNSIETVKSLVKIGNYDIIVDDLVLGGALISRQNFGPSGIKVTGPFSNQVVFGDASVAVSVVRFGFPNLREFSGAPTQATHKETLSISNGRQVFDNEKYELILDRLYDNEERREALNMTGGYHLLYAGELRKKGNSITLEEAREILFEFSSFMTFLNGRNTSAMFATGMHENKRYWQDFTDYHIDSYRNVTTWPNVNEPALFNDCYQRFRALWKNEENRSFLHSAISWYCMCNGDTSPRESALIMAQATLELLYNWLLIETKGLIIGKDAENLNASNKIRLLLAQIRISYEAPAHFKHLSEYIEKTDELSDAPDAIVGLRNAVVHGQLGKRKKVWEMHYMTKYEALQLCIWYIEMSMLFILEFDGKYLNRCSKNRVESARREMVPWS